MEIFKKSDKPCAKQSILLKMYQFLRINSIILFWSTTLLFQNKQHYILK